MSHSPEPWQIIKHSESGDMDPVEVLADASGEMLYDVCRCHDESHTPTMSLDDMRRAVACVNACRGLPMFNGTISVVADMKAAIMAEDAAMLSTIRNYLRDVCFPEPKSAGH